MDVSGPTLISAQTALRMAMAQFSSPDAGAAAAAAAAAAAKAVPPPAVRPTGAAGTYTDLDTRYKRLVAEYDELSQRALSLNDRKLLPVVRAKMEEITKVLNQMVESITFLRKDTPNLSMERSILLEKLRRIQRDYNGMIANTDDLETLRRIREQESDSGKTLLYQYLAVLVALAVALIGIVLFMGSQTNANTAIIPSTPVMSPTLT